MNSKDNLIGLYEDDNFVPPSEDIQQLFKRSNKLNMSPSCESDTSYKSNNAIENYSFTEEEFSKMPSTLMKAVRRTDELLQQTETLRKCIIEMNNELKGVHSLVVRYAKKTLKDLEKNDTSSSPENMLENGKAKGFKVQCKISDEMCVFMGLEPGSTSSRIDVNKTINQYVRDNGLIDPENAQRILPDEKLWLLLSESAKGNKITYFSIQKYIKHHFIKKQK